MFSMMVEGGRRRSWQICSRRGLLSGGEEFLSFFAAMCGIIDSRFLTEDVICFASVLVRLMAEGDAREVLDTVVTELMDAITHHDTRVGAALEKYKDEKDKFFS
ncbi:phosphoglucosamine mutase [Bartonella tribocorum]|nr:phosphoglucosamine mutase [Bartonella tribocorum]